MLSRSERVTPIATTGCTNEQVGPGSYSLLDSPKQPNKVATAAAFGTGAQRFALAAAPQPAAADEAADSTSTQQSTTAPVRSWAANSVSSSFASSTQRFLLDKETVAKPGPGAYNTTGLAWRQQQQQQASWHLPGSRKPPNFTPSTALIGAPVRVPGPACLSGASAAASGAGASTQRTELLLSTPPSIPARHQSYGYEPGPGGQLVMQPPPPAPAPPAAPSAAATAGTATAASARGSASGKCSGGAGTAAKGSSSRWGPSGRPSTVPSSSSSLGRNKPPSQQLRQQLQAAQEPAGQQLGNNSSSSPRFRCAAGGKLVLRQGSCTGSAAFASKSARLHQQEPDPATLTPGPGAYTSSSSSSSSTRPSSAPLLAGCSPHAAPHAAARTAAAAAAGPAGFLTSPRRAQQQPLFARAAGRSAVLSVGPGWSLPPSKSVAPGPGTYNLRPGPGLSKAAQVAGMYGGARGSQCVAGGPQAAAAGGAAAAGAAGTAAAAATGFGCTSRRFGDDNTVSPGPGKYTADQLLSMSAEAAKKAAAASRRGAFGTTSGSSSSGGGRPDRLLADCLGLSSSSGQATLGPGCYDVCGGLTAAAAAAARPSAGFASASERFTAAVAPIAAPYFSKFDGTTLPGDQARLGPGAYLPLEDWRQAGSKAGRVGYRSTAFGSEAGRHTPASLAAAAEAAPGPGAYSSVDVSKVFQPLSMPGSRAGFCTSSQRFKQAVATPDVVGPGSYSAHGSLVKPSFNVTLDGAWGDDDGL